MMTNGIKVKGDLEGAIKRLKFKTAKDGTLAQAKKRYEGYKKPGVQRREAIKEGIKNTKRNNRRKSA